MEKILVGQLLRATKVGKTVLTNARGIPIMRISHIHYKATRVEAYDRGAYDSISLDKL